MNKYTVSMISEPSPSAPMYDGDVDVWAETEDEAIDAARAKVNRIHEGRTFRVRGVTRTS